MFVNGLTNAIGCMSACLSVPPAQAVSATAHKRPPAGLTVTSAPPPRRESDVELVLVAGREVDGMHFTKS
ncbi:hypothetical protein Dac01nite_01850 [Demequina activiva]|uniref:Uncharacterized protein n=1 Tax=Demequina activiva TaxID=1582364 RepID=A0A919Q346_9MICO|nr:hypothetical protein Dac01nite_01850 [Demequina activiva]